jgi:hypothetical protein
MVDVLMLLWSALTSLFRSRMRLEAEILVLQQQINVLRRNSPKRFVFRTSDRLVFVGLYRLVPGIVDALTLVRPETVVRWHRAGFRSFWRWKSRRRGGRPNVPLEIRKLIRDMSLANPLWGAPRIHGELLKLGIDVGQTSVAKYMARRRGGPSRQLTEACGWEAAPDYIVRDRDCAYGEAFVRRLRAMGIRDRPTAPRSPWQNAYAERLIGSIRREALDHVVVLGERHLRHLLLSYMTYHNEARTHLSLDKDAPIPREVQGVGRIFAKPHLGGLHHQYVRI